MTSELEANALREYQVGTLRNIRRFLPETVKFEIFNGEVLLTSYGNMDKNIVNKAWEKAKRITTYEVYIYMLLDDPVKNKEAIHKCFFDLIDYLCKS